MTNQETESGPVRQANVNGIVGVIFSAGSVIGWIVLCSMMVSYDTGVEQPQSTGDQQRDVSNSLAYTTDVAMRKSVVFAANSFLFVVGGMLSLMFLVIGVVTSGIGLANENRRLPFIGLSLCAISMICGILFMKWRWSVWFS